MPHQTSTVIGRDNELLVLFNAYQALNDGRGGVITLCGNTGIGKTTLASSIISTIKSSEGECVVINGYQSERTAGLRAVRELLNSRVFEAFHDDLTRVIDSFDSLKRGTIGDASNQERFHFICERIGKLVGVACNKFRLVILIDDLQWLDESSLAFVRFLCRLTNHVPLLLILAARQDSDAVVIGPFLDGRYGPVLHLLPFTKDELSSYVRHKTNRETLPHVSAALWKRTHGHPYLVGEVLRCMSGYARWTVRSIREAAPPSTTLFLTRQMVGLSSRSRLVLSIMSVLGRPTSHAIVRRAVGLSSPTFLMSLQELHDRDLIYDNAGKLNCAHDLVRESVYGALSIAQRRILHRRLARVLRIENAATADALYHLRLGGCRREAYTAALTAARRSIQIGAGRECDYYYRVASAACSSNRKREVLRWKRATAAVASGLLRTAKSLLEKIQREQGPLYRKYEARVLFYLLEVDHELSLAQPVRIFHRACVVSALAAERKDVEAQVSALVIKARTHLLDGDVDGDRVRETIAELAAAADKNPNSSATAHGLAWAAGALVFMGRPADAEEILVGIAHRTVALGDTRFLSVYRASEALLAAHRGEITRSITLFRSAAAYAELRGMWRHRKNILGNLSGVLIETGDDIATEATLAELIQAARVDEGLPHLSLAHINYSLLRLARGDLTGAREHAQRGLQLGEKLQRPWTIAYSTALLGLVALQQGKMMDARACTGRITALDGKYFGNDILPMERLIVRLAELDHNEQWAICRLQELIASKTQLSALCRAGLELELARLLLKLDVPRAFHIAQNAREKCRTAGAVRLFDVADALLTRAAIKS